MEVQCEQHVGIPNGRFSIVPGLSRFLVEWNNPPYITLHSNLEATLILPSSRIAWGGRFLRPPSPSFLSSVEAVTFPALIESAIRKRSCQCVLINSQLMPFWKSGSI